VGVELGLTLLAHSNEPGDADAQTDARGHHGEDDTQRETVASLAQAGVLLDVAPHCIGRFHDDVADDGSCAEDAESDPGPNPARTLAPRVLVRGVDREGDEPRVQLKVARHNTLRLADELAECLDLRGRHDGDGKRGRGRCDRRAVLISRA
jgi:hypothetical protein